MIDDERPAGVRPMQRWLAAAAALAFSAAPLQALTPQGRLVAMSTGDGPATMLLLIPPAGPGPDRPHRPDGCSHALCARDRQLPGRRTDAG